MPVPVCLCACSKCDVRFKKFAVESLSVNVRDLTSGAGNAARVLHWEKQAARCERCSTEAPAKAGGVTPAWLPV